MGCGASKEDTAGKARNDEIENQLKRDKMAQRNEIKMLLLGMSIFYVGTEARMLNGSQALVNLGNRPSSSR
jgi:hypothetical protein